MKTGMAQSNKRRGPEKGYLPSRFRTTGSSSPVPSTHHSAIHFHVCITQSSRLLPNTAAHHLQSWTSNPVVEFHHSALVSHPLPITNPTAFPGPALPLSRPPAQKESQAPCYMDGIKHPGKSIAAPRSWRLLRRLPSSFLMEDSSNQRQWKANIHTPRRSPECLSLGT
ncbi:hypothetical protein B0T21DRAFT_193329 [Apiosordaria backusii]|uniref:Uncharacterized protein n=1 Tax=Apiosordaria backusii TaxID=314023 RepID=A0AA40EFS9_9PEZI|nr:hypothetical protein B0T21DRAFT_193329 [Apiosordaria backusii]